MRVSPVIIVAALSLTAAQAAAYVLPPEFLARQLAERRQNLKMRDLSLQLHTELTAHNEPIEERLYLKFPERLRRVQQGGDEEIYVQREGKSARGKEGALSLLDGDVDLTARLLVPRGNEASDMATRILSAMKSAGVNMRVVALGRYEERPVYIIGARPWEPDEPQVWLDKATFLPVRVKVRASVDGKTRMVDTHFKEYGSSVAANWYPRVVETYHDGELVRHAEVVAAKINQDLPETLFQLPR